MPTRALASSAKGPDFTRKCKRQGCPVLCLTPLSIKDKAAFPADSIDEIFYMPDEDHKWDRTQTINAVSYLFRTRPIDRIVPLDDFDAEVAAILREHW